MDGSRAVLKKGGDTSEHRVYTCSCIQSDRKEALYENGKDL